MAAPNNPGDPFAAEPLGTRPVDLVLEGGGAKGIGLLDEPVRTTLGLAVRALRTLTSDWNRYRLDEEGVSRRTVFVDTSGISATYFDLTQDDQTELFEQGRDAAALFLRQIGEAP